MSNILVKFLVLYKNFQKHIAVDVFLKGFQWYHSHADPTWPDGTLPLKGSHSMWDMRIFLKSLRDASFNKDLSSEPTFGRIHVAGQYL
jgi:hypothetical protein